MSLSVLSPAIVAVPSESAPPFQANVAAVTVSYANRGPTALSEVVVAIPAAPGMRVPPYPPAGSRIPYLPWIPGAVAPSAVDSQGFVFARPSLGPGASATLSFGLVFTMPGSARIIARVTSRDVEVESDPITITVAPAASATLAPALTPLSATPAGPPLTGSRGLDADLSIRTSQLFRRQGRPR